MHRPVSTHASVERSSSARTRLRFAPSARRNASSRSLRFAVSLTIPKTPTMRYERGALRPPTNRRPTASRADPYILRATLSLTTATSGWRSAADATACGGWRSFADCVAADGWGCVADSSAPGDARAAPAAAAVQVSVSAKPRPASSGVPMASK